MSNAGIVSLQRQPPDPFQWLRFHVAEGITSFYLWLEESDDLKPQLEAYAAQLSAETGIPIRMHIVIADKINRATEDNYADLQTRQATFVNKMIAQARADGVGWLFHLDADELLHARSMDSWPKVLAQVDPSCISVHIANYEGFSPAQPAGSWITDPGIRYMPSQCGPHFASYANGKSASRTTLGQAAHGPHHFTGGKECELPESDGVVLHHDSLAMGPRDVPPAEFLEKTHLRLGSDLSKIPFSFTKESVAAMKTGDNAALATVWARYRSQTGQRFGQCPATLGFQLPSHAW